MKMTKEDKQRVREQYEKVWRNDQKMVDYCTKRTSGYIMIDGIMVTFDKPHIKTDFWFGEHTYDYDEVVEHCDKCSESEAYFIEENMHDFKWRLENLADPCVRVYLSPRGYCCQDDDCILGCVEFCRYYDKPRSKNAREMTEEERAEYAKFIEEESEKFEKRLHAYLKRYGLSKCHYGVFWADR